MGQLNLRLFCQQRIKLQQGLHLVCQVQRLASGCQQAVVGLGQVQHVVNQLCHPLQFFEVAVQGLAVRINVPWPGQRYLSVGQYVGERGAQLMGDVGGER